MINTIKKKLKNLFKQTAYSIFKIIYGEIKGIVNPNSDSRIIVDKVKLFGDNEYKIFSIDMGRIYTDTINDNTVDQTALGLAYNFNPNFRLVTEYVIDGVDGNEDQLHMAARYDF